MDDVCPDCGTSHAPQFSPRVIELYRELNASKDPVEQRAILVELASEYTRDVDVLSLDVPEPLHFLVDEVVRKQVEFEQIALRLGRTILEAVARVADAEDESPSEASKTPHRPN